MTYRVVIAEAVQLAVQNQIAYYRSVAVPQRTIAAWLRGLLDRVEGLHHLPRRYPVAGLVSEMKGYEVRRLNYGDSAVFCRVNPERKVVEIIAFRHGRQKPMA